MKIINHTQYDSKAIKAFVYRSSKLCWGAGKKVSKISVYLEYTQRGRSASGRAMIGGWYIKVRVPREFIPSNLTAPEEHKQKLVKIHKRAIAWVIAHELGHSIGLKHRRKSGHLMKCHYDDETLLNDPELEFADTFPLPMKEVHEATKTEIYNKKLEYAQTNLKRIISRIKRLETAKKKWLRRIKLYSLKGGE